MPEQLLLDTCALIWLVQGNERIGEDLRERIDSAARVSVSAISAWEISLKAARGELVLPMESEEWFGRVVRHHRLAVEEIRLTTLFAANRLDWHHRDPADRIILATAQLGNFTVVTADRKFAAYSVAMYWC